MELNNIKQQMIDENIIYDVSDLFKVLGDSTRTKILNVLNISDLCVNDISDCLGMSKSAVSHQLRILRQAKLVKTKKLGKSVIYSLDDDHVTQIIKCAITHVME